MKFKVNREKFLDALAIPIAAIPAHCSKPAMMLLKIMAKVPGRLDLAGTGPDIGVIQTMAGGVEVSRGGDALVQPDKLKSLLKVMADEFVELAESDAGTVLLGAGARYVLPGDSPEHFPKIEVLAETPEFFCEASSLAVRELMVRTLFCTQKHDTSARWAVSSALFGHADGKLRVVSTDTKRLSVASCAVTAGAGGAVPDGLGKSLVPREAMELLKSACENDDKAPVRVVFEENQIWFQVGGLTIRTRLMNGSFPPWEQILPKGKAPHEIRLDRAGFLGVMRAAGKFTDEETKRVELDFEPGKVTVSAKDGVNDASGEITHEAAGCKSRMNIAFNPQYLIEFLRSVEAADVTMLATDGGKPVVFRPSDDYAHLIMPLSSD